MGSSRSPSVKKLKTVPQGAATTVWCATSPVLDEIDGVYCEDADIARLDNDDRFISGETKIIQAGCTYVFRAGDIFLIPLNHLVTISNYPKDGRPHQGVVIHLCADQLREFYAEIDIKPRAQIARKNPGFEDLSHFSFAFKKLFGYPPTAVMRGR